MKCVEMAPKPKPVRPNLHHDKHSNAARHRVANARGLVNGFDYRYTSSTFFSIANRIATCFDRLDEVFNNPLMSANVAHHRRTRAGVLVCGFDLICESRWIA